MVKFICNEKASMIIFVNERFAAGPTRASQCVIDAVQGVLATECNFGVAF